MANFTPIPKGAAFRKEILHEKMDQILQDASEVAQYKQITSYVNIGGLTSYTITDIPTTLTLLELHIELRSELNIRINGDTSALYGRRTHVNGAGNAGIVSDTTFQITDANGGFLNYHIIRFYNKTGVAITRSGYVTGVPVQNSTFQFGRYRGAMPITSLTFFASTPWASGSGFMLYGLP